MPQEDGTAPEQRLDDLAFRLADNGIDTAKSLLQSVVATLEIVADRPMEPELIRSIAKAMAKAEGALETLEASFPDEEEEGDEE